jgi:hypothetical protein
MYLEIVDSAAPGLLEGLYVVGSYALGDWHEATSDIDIVAVTAEPATEKDAGALLAAHTLLSERLPRPYVDGPYLAWGDLPVAPATGLHRPWSLDGRFHHDGECFEINPVTWYTLATYGVTVRGPAVETLDIALDVNDRVRFVVDNLASYWTEVADQLAAVAPEREFDAASFEWCALGALRLHYTAFTGDVISKSAAADYGIGVAPEQFHSLLRGAAAMRRSQVTERRVVASEMRAAGDLIRWICADVAASARR